MVNLSKNPAPPQKTASKDQIRRLKHNKIGWKRDLSRNWVIYLLFLPCMVYFLIFNYVPMLGVLMAFQDVDATNVALFGGKWVGLDNFARLFTTSVGSNFGLAIRNTAVMSLFSITIGFMVPIVLAVLVSEVRAKYFKRTVQTATYMPYFVSAVVVCAIVKELVGDQGAVTAIAQFFGYDGGNLLSQASPPTFWLIYLFTDIWQNAGYSSIVFVKGKYTVVREVYKPFGTDCGDFDLAKDGATGQGYLYWEVDHTAVWGAKLSGDYTEAVDEPAVIYENMQPPFTREAVTHMERNGKHYLFTSGMTGYVPNPSEVAVSDDWLTGYRVLGDPHVDDDSRSSFNSQISGILKVEGRELYVAIADRWVPDFVMTGEKYDIIVRAITARYDETIQVTPEEKAFFNQIPVGGSANTSIADYVWLPIRWEGDMPRIPWRENWSPEEF